MKSCLALLLALIVTVSFTARSSAGDRHALVIGNARYPDADAPLKEPVNDARDMASELKREGFTVEIGENLTGDGMRRAFDRFYATIKPGDVALLFFSGYGIQSNRQSYMMPVDCQLWQESDVRRDGFSLEAVLNDINNRGAGVKIALLDASRRNPYERRFRSFSAGLVPVVAPNGSLVMYSAALSSVASDGGRDHGLFVEELLKEIRAPGLMAEETLNKVRIGISRASHQEQIPWISSSLSEDFYFVPGAETARPTAQTAEQSAPEKAPAPPPLVRSPSADAGPPPPAAPPKTGAQAASQPPAATDGKPAPASASPVPTQVAMADDPTIKSLTTKIEANPDDVSALYRRGQVYASKGAYSLAIKDFDDTLRLSPKDVEALNNRCWARTVVGELQSALKDCNEALRLRPNFVDALDSRGLVNLKSGMNKNAIADFDAALKINPRLTSSLYGRGLAKQRIGSVSEGSLDVANAKAMDPNIVQEFESYGVR